MTKSWSPTADDFSTFIDWLDAGVPSGGRSYTEMHGRLSAYFARKSCRAPDRLADETLARVARRLQEEGGIIDVTPAQYCYIVARFVLLEEVRSPDRAGRPLRYDLPDRVSTEEADRRERQLKQLDTCLARLAAEDRDLILSYYAGEGPGRIATRRDLAATLGLSANALMIRASRLRDRLRACVAGRGEDI